MYLESRLLCVWSSPLLMHLGKQQEDGQVPWPLLQLGIPGWNPGLLASGWPIPVSAAAIWRLNQQTFLITFRFFIQINRTWSLLMACLYESQNYTEKQTEVFHPSISSLPKMATATLSQKGQRFRNSSITFFHQQGAGWEVEQQENKPAAPYGMPAQQTGASLLHHNANPIKMNLKETSCFVSDKQPSNICIIIKS